MLKQRKGILLAEETIKIVIALICIVFLIYLLVTLYYTKVGDAKLNQAKATLKDSNTSSIKSGIEKVKIGQGNLGGTSEELLIHNPNSWYLFSFVQNELKPNECVGENCICICSNVGKVGVAFWKSEQQRQLEECDKKGTCLIVKDLIRFKEIEISPATEILIKNDNGISIIKK